MNDLQIAVATVLGAVLVMRRDASQNRAKFLGIEFEVSTPALVVLLIGAGLLVGPAFTPHRPGGWPSPSAATPAPPGMTLRGDAGPRSPSERRTDSSSDKPAPPVKAEPPPQPVAGQPKATYDSTYKDVVASVTGFNVTGPYVTLGVKFENTGNSHWIEFCVDPSLAILVDANTGEPWKAESWQGKLECENKPWLYAGNKHFIWMRFNVGEHTSRKFNAMIPNVAELIKELKQE